MALPWLGAVVVTTVTVAVAERRSLAAVRPVLGTSLEPSSAPAPRGDPVDPTPAPLVVGFGALAVATVAVLVVALANPALPVAGVGLVAITTRLVSRRQRWRTSSRCWGSRCWSACSGSPWPSAPSGGCGQVRPPCSPTWTRWAPPWWRRPRRCWSTTSRRQHCWPRGSPPSLRPTGRPQPRSQSLRHRLTGLDPLVADGTVRRLGPPGAPCGGDRVGHRAPLDGRRPRVAGRHRFAVAPGAGPTTRPPGVMLS